MNMFTLATIVFAASLGINIVAWLRYAYYGGAFKSNLIVGISATVLTFVVLFIGIITFIGSYGWPTFWLCFATLAMPCLSGAFFVTRKDQ